jgi:hypothetical protein
MTHITFATNKYRVLYVAMDETTNFTSHMSHEPWLFLCEKNHILFF